jgi:NADH dehydrogenase/NADH:ubiquinone oxidoreductase subunit G
MGALVSGDLVAIVAATPQYEAYVKAKRVLYAAQKAMEDTSSAANVARNQYGAAAEDLQRAQEELDVAIEEALR